MGRIKAKLSNCLEHLGTTYQINLHFQRILALVGLLQIISAVTHPSSLLHHSAKWVDPSAIFQPRVSIMLGCLWALVFTLLLLLKLKLSNGGKMIGESGAWREYLNVMICYILQVCKAAMVIPSIRGSLLEVSSMTQPLLFCLAVLNLIIYWIIIFPVALIIDSNTTALTPNTNRYLTSINTQTLIDIFRFLLATSSVANTGSTTIVASLFLSTYIVMAIKRPITCFLDQQFKKAVASAAAFCCIVRIFNQMLYYPQRTFLLQFLGMFSFIAAAQFIARLRVKSILQLAEPKVYQIKLLLYLSQKPQEHLDLLQHFIIRHSRQCQEPSCPCRTVISNFIVHSFDPSCDQIWYEFLASYIITSYRIDHIKKQNKSQMQAKTIKYSSLVFNLAEILLFKLNSPIKSYLTISQYRQYLEGQYLTQVWSSSKNKAISFYLEKAFASLRRRYDVFNYDADKAINLHADRCIQFQKQFCNYLELMLTSALKIEDFCMQMSRTQPDERALTVLLTEIGRQFLQIKMNYKILTSNYPESNQIIDPILRDYYKMVLNVSENQPIDILQTGQQAPLQTQKKYRKRRLNENLHLFSYDSQTPMIIISADDACFGRIQVQNAFFKELLVRDLGRAVTSMDDLLIPQIRQGHRKVVEAFRESNKFSYQQRSVFLFGSRNQIIAMDLMIQMVLSIRDGLQYAVFIKNAMPFRKVVLLTNNYNVAYCSKSCQVLLEQRQDGQNRIKALPKDLPQNINQSMSFSIQGELITLKYLSRVNTSKNPLFYMQIIKQTTKNIVNESSEPQSQDRKAILKTSKESKSRKYREKKIKFSGNEAVEEKSQSQQRQDEIIKKIYGVLMGNTKGRKISRSINLATVCLGITIIALLISAMLYKSKEKQAIYSIFQSSQQFEQLMKVLGDVSMTLKVINLNSYKGLDTNSTNQQYAKLAQTSSIYDLYKSSLSYFDINDVQQTWKTLTFNKNGSIVPGTLGSFKAVPDLLENPLDNLKETNISNFNFPFSYNYLTPPLTTTQTFFYNFLTNAIYFAIPNLRTFRLYRMIEMFTMQLSNITPYIILLGLVMVAIVLGFIPILLLYRKVGKLISYSHRSIESISPQVFLMRLRSCRKFIESYSVLNDRKDDSRSQRLISPVVSCKIDSSNKIGEKDGQTQREIGRKTSAFCLGEMDQVSNPQQGNQERNSQTTIRRNQPHKLTRPSYKYLVIGYLLLSTPMMGCLGGLMVSSSSLKKGLSVLLQIQYGCGFIRSDLKLIELYSFHFGVYDYQLQQYKSIGKYLAQLIYTNFYIFQLLLTTVGESIDLDGLEFFQMLQYSDLCKLQQQGAFGGFQSELISSRNYTECSSISHGILTKGYVSTILNYLEAANNLFLTNPYTVIYNETQKLAYLNSPFFTDNAQSLDYLDMVFSQFIYKNKQNLDTLIRQCEIIFVSICLCLIAVDLILLIFLRKYYIKQQQQNIQQVSTIFTLVSCQTILSHRELRGDFLNAIDDLKDIK